MQFQGECPVCGTARQAAKCFQQHISLRNCHSTERKERAFTRGPVTERSEEMGNVRASSDRGICSAQSQGSKRLPSSLPLHEKHRIWHHSWVIAADVKVIGLEFICRSLKEPQTSSLCVLQEHSNLKGSVKRSAKTLPMPE